MPFQQGFQLVQILKEPKNSLIKQYQKLFELDHVDLQFDPEALEAIADKSLERKTGARGLRAIMEKTMMDLMYSAPDQKDRARVTVTADVIKNKAQPLIIRKKAA